MSDTNENCPHYRSQVSCESCGHNWVAVHPVLGEDCTPLECPSCGKNNWVSLVDPRPVHLVISNINGHTYIKPSRAVPNWRIKLLLQAAMEMTSTAGSDVVVDPSECSLRVILSVDEDQVKLA